MICFASAESKAQGLIPTWGNPINISNSSLDSSSPSIVADANGGLHLFWREELLFVEGGSSSAIFYSYKDDMGWSQPVDILIPPIDGGEANFPRAAIDATGMVHLVWRGGFSDRVYYSAAPVQLAGSAQAWSTIELARHRGEPRSPAIVVDSKGCLHVTYAVIVGQERGVYCTSTCGDGKLWPEPELILGSSGPANTFLEGVRMAVDRRDRLHVVWKSNVFPNTTTGTTIHYFQSSDHGETWTEIPIPGEGPYNDPDVAVIGDDEVHLVWAGTHPTRAKFHIWSRDGGQTWSSPEEIPGLAGGYQGYSDMTVDSAGLLHLAIISSHFALEHDGVFHIMWDGQGWVGPEFLFEPHAVGNNPRDASLAISEGNLLHVVAMNPEPPPAGDGYQFDIEYVSQRTEAPHVQPVPLPTLEPSPTPARPTRVPAATGTSPPSPVASALVRSPEPNSQSLTNMVPILAGTLPILMLVIVIFVLRRFRDRRG